METRESGKSERQTSCQPCMREEGEDNPTSSQSLGVLPRSKEGHVSKAFDSKTLFPIHKGAVMVTGDG
ncbi:hypothetical protein E4U43_006207 [Claviceps pusilla]|uniref:Uncharacterized protein n=1 Tax=Claviceps pusilla TaxID=123648 RepID=A0A9P7SSX7_9HYPO|nr:hypothetical protein E4U43_006207 [Claviceps pusilla]